MRNNSRGFTLIELLVAISILGLVAVLGWRGLDGIVRARIAISNDVEQTRGMQLAFAQMQSDCAHFAVSTSLRNRLTLDVAPGRITLIRNVYSDNQPSRLQVVAYRLGGGVLTRTESAATRNLKVLDTYWQAAENDTDASPAVVLLSDVDNLTMRLWFNDNSGWRTSVSQIKPAQDKNPSLPTGLEVTLKLQRYNAGLQKIFLLGAI